MKEKPIINLQFYLLILGSILVLFASTYLFTRPSIWPFFNFNETAPIGDTIGGITSPIINIIGFILIYISFKAQINANKIQFKLVQIEIQNQTFDRNFEIALDLFKELKLDYKTLEHSESNGQSALNIFVYEIDGNWSKETFVKHTKKPIYIDWQFIICEYDLLLNHIMNSKMRKIERYKIFTIVYNFYVIQLEYSINNIVVELNKFELDKVTTNMIEKFKQIHANYLLAEN